MGSGRIRPGQYNNVNKECKARRGVVVINNNDNLCLARALVVGKAYAKNDPQVDKDRCMCKTIKAHI